MTQPHAVSVRHSHVYSSCVCCVSLCVLLLSRCKIFERFAYLCTQNNSFEEDSERVGREGGWTNRCVKYPLHGECGSLMLVLDIKLIHKLIMVFNLRSHVMCSTRHCELRVCVCVLCAPCECTHSFTSIFNLICINSAIFLVRNFDRWQKTYLHVHLRQTRHSLSLVCARPVAVGAAVRHRHTRLKKKSKNKKR